MSSYRAFRCHQEGGRVEARFDTLPARDAASLAPGEVALAVAWSGINYKDALAATGAGRIMRRFPLTAGIDVAGVVEASNDPRFRPGDPAVVVGCGLGEEVDGGFAERAWVQGDWIVTPPPGLTLRDAMAIGTAGFTAALALERMEHNGLRPGQGPVAVTGATGGVGSLAVAMLAARGYDVTAISAKRTAAPYLTALGAATVVHPDDLGMGTRPLDTARWAGAIDNLGGAMLAWLCASTRPLGTVASVGLAQSPALETTVMPGRAAARHQLHLLPGGTADGGVDAAGARPLPGHPRCRRPAGRGPGVAAGGVRWLHGRRAHGTHARAGVGCARLNGRRARRHRARVERIVSCPVASPPARAHAAGPRSA
jgi:NADPH2:quinone reductase